MITYEEYIIIETIEDYDKIIKYYNNEIVYSGSGIYTSRSQHPIVGEIYLNPLTNECFVYDGFRWFTASDPIPDNRLDWVLVNEFYEYTKARYTGRVIKMKPNSIVCKSIILMHKMEQI